MYEEEIPIYKETRFYKVILSAALFLAGLWLAIKLIDSLQNPISVPDPEEAAKVLVKQAAENQNNIINQLQTPLLGFEMVDLTPSERLNLGLRQEQGILVKNIEQNSPAQQAGLLKNDIILMMNGQDIGSNEDVGNILENLRPSDRIKLLIKRGKWKKTIYFKLMSKSVQLAALKEIPVWFGLDVMAIDGVMQQQFHLPDTKGVIISNIEKNSPASLAGLQIGDVIRRINNRRIDTTTNFRDKLLNIKSYENIRFMIFRDGKYLEIKISASRNNHIKRQGPGMLGPAEIAIEGSWIGMDLTQLESADAKAMGLPADSKGILVSDVEGPPAMSCGFQTGDVIVAVNQRPTLNMRQFEAATQQQIGAIVEVIRGGRHEFLTVPPPGYNKNMEKMPKNNNSALTTVGFFQKKSARVAIPVVYPSIDAAISRTLSGGPYILVYDPENNQAKSIPNPLYSGIKLDRLLITEGINSIIIDRIRQDLAKQLNVTGIVVYTGISGSARNAILNYNKGNLSANVTVEGNL